MNSVHTFLQQNRHRLGLANYDVPSKLTALILTPRFRASRHVVFLVMPHDMPEPVLVAKVPRLIDTNHDLKQEAESLKAIQLLRSGGFETIPQVVTYETFFDREILVETAINGTHMDPSSIQRDLSGSCVAVLEWLVELYECSSGLTDSDWIDRVIEKPFNAFTSKFPLTGDEQQLLSRAKELTVPLRDAQLFYGLEHGDLGHPNIIKLKSGGIGVVDWELSDIRGLVASDLFFFLTFAGASIQSVKQPDDLIKAFHDTFFSPSAWAQPYLEIYFERLNLSPALLKPLFILTWTRYLATLILRLSNPNDRQYVEMHTARWVRSNRYYKLWRHAVMHIDEIVGVFST